MPEEFYAMTIQGMKSDNSRAPYGAHTAEGIIETDGMTAKEVYDAVLKRAIESWQSDPSFSMRDLRHPSVVFYHREPNSPEAPAS